MAKAGTEDVEFDDDDDMGIIMAVPSMARFVIDQNDQTRKIFHSSKICKLKG
jgi:hypothetical protein